MKTDNYGQIILTENDLCDLYMRDTTRTIKSCFVDKQINLDNIFLSEENLPILVEYVDTKLSLEEFDELNQLQWQMPQEYYEMDIAKWVLDQCKNEEELQRAGDELLKFHDRNMFSLLKYLKYLVDTMRRNNIVWGVGRGSSVASYVLYLIGIHRINSLYYQLSVDEFLK
jgi:DNA polymerase III alpha subunit